MAPACPCAMSCDGPKFAASADQILSTSVDGMTISTPVDALLDDRGAPACGRHGRTAAHPMHGYPVRLVTPAYGAMSVPRVADPAHRDDLRRPAGLLDRARLGRAREVQTQARIDLPRDRRGCGRPGRDRRSPGPKRDKGISRVEVRVDDGDWVEADLGPDAGGHYWRQWRTTWKATASGRRHTVTVRAVDGTGAAQTDQVADPFPSGATGLHTSTSRWTDPRRQWQPMPGWRPCRLTQPRPSRSPSSGAGGRQPGATVASAIERQVPCHRGRSVRAGPRPAPGPRVETATDLTRHLLVVTAAVTAPCAPRAPLAAGRPGQRRHLVVCRSAAAAARPRHWLARRRRRGHRLRSDRRRRARAVGNHRRDRSAPAFCSRGTIGSRRPISSWTQSLARKPSSAGSVRIATDDRAIGPSRPTPGRLYCAPSPASGKTTRGNPQWVLLRGTGPAGP